MKKNCLIYFCFALLTLQGSAAMACPAGDPTCNGVEVEPLFFGQLVITDNSAMRSCLIPAGGSITCDSQITVLNPGQAQYGVFQLSGYGTTAVWFSVDDSTTQLKDSAGTTAFNVKSFTFAPVYNSIGTEQALPGGTLMLKIGATLETVAGESYDLAPYRGTYSLQINY
jgi:hypothetical protein